MGHALINEAQFRDIEARWKAAFDPPYDARAELWDGDMRVGLCVIRDGAKIFEEMDNLADPLTNARELTRYADAVKARLGITGPPATNTE
jgi:hypothetical protein